MKNFDIKMGIPKPHTTEDQLKIQSEISNMRQVILRGRFDSGLISRCFTTAEAQGLSGEETYVLLAYHALVMLEDLWQRQLNLSMLDIHKIHIMPEEMS